MTTDTIDDQRAIAATRRFLLMAYGYLTADRATNDHVTHAHRMATDELAAHVWTLTSNGTHHHDYPGHLTDDLINRELVRKAEQR